jgi:phosphoribosylanthranilate isomerase
MIRIKICGITNLEDARMAADIGADALGFVFAESPRRIDPDMAKRIIRSLPPFINKVGVFVNEHPDIIRNIYRYCGLSVVQLHGDEDLDYIRNCPFPVIKAFKVRGESILDQIMAFNLACYLLDTFDAHHAGGTGRKFDWRIAKAATQIGKVILSGGLDNTNIKDALAEVNPYAVDVSSGVEKSPGKKDKNKLETFIHEVKNWDSLTN